MYFKTKISFRVCPRESDGGFIGNVVVSAFNRQKIIIVSLQCDETVYTGGNKLFYFHSVHKCVRRYLLKFVTLNNIMTCFRAEP